MVYFGMYIQKCGVYTVVFLALLKIALVYAYICIYCYYENLYLYQPPTMYAHIYIYIGGALLQTIYITLIGYTIFNRLSVLVKGCLIL